MLPRDSDLSGWNRKGSPEDYDGRRIRKYRNDYNGIGIERISCCSYESIGDNKPVITVEVIKFNNVMNSYGLFSRIAAGSDFVPKTENEFYSSNRAAALRGEYLVYIHTEPENEDNAPILKSFIITSLKYIGTSYSRENLNELINLLKYRDKYGIIYSVKPVGNQDGIDKIYYTLWNSNKKLVYVFISERTSFADSYLIFKERVKRGYILVESGTSYTAFNRDSNGTFSFISANDKWIYGCWSSPDIETGKKIIEELKVSISDYNLR
jgi:hypothetical protein